MDSSGKYGNLFIKIHDSPNLPFTQIRIPLKAMKGKNCLKNLIIVVSIIGSLAIGASDYVAGTLNKGEQRR